jgi:hypothetical protein
MIYKLTNVTPKTWQDKQFFEATLTDEANNFSEKVSAWNGEIKEGQTEIDCELYKNAKGYWAISAPKKAAGGAGIARSMEVKATNIAVAQEKKADNIAEAQRRTAWMWAKNCATDLYVADRIGSKLDNEDEALRKIESIANSIFHMEYTPFN